MRLSESRRRPFKVACVMLLLATSFVSQSDAAPKNAKAWGKGGKKQDSTTLTDTSSSSSTLTSADTGSADLSWVAPTTRADGSPLLLSEIAGYVLYYGPEQGSYANSIGIDDSSTTSLTVTDLPAGTYYFVVTARDASGNESDYSDSVSRQIP